MSNIALICLYGVENNGIRTISSMLKKEGFNTFVIFFKRWINNDIRLPSYREKETLISLIQELNIDLVGMSFTSPFLKIAGELTRSIKNTVQVPVVWGGIHATARPEECLEYCDIAVRGEGEYVMVDLARACTPGGSLTGIKNICYKKENRVFSEGMRPLIQDLDSLPYEDYAGSNKFFIENGLHRVDPLIHARELRVFASRGCPFDCAYCYNSILRQLYKDENKYHRIKSVEHVISQIEHALGAFQKIKKIKFDDDTFVFPHDWIDEFVEKYKNRIGLPFEILFNAQCLNTHVLSKLRTAGLEKIQVGIQTGSQNVSEQLYNRGLHSDDIRQTADAASGLHIGVVYDAILDNPLATAQDRQSLISFLLGLPRPFDLFMYSLTIFPGTALCELLLQKGLISRADIEGNANKSFYQFRFSFAYPRKREELFSACIVSLISKSFVPRPFIVWLNRNKFLLMHPLPLVWFAEFCNAIKLLCVLVRMSFKGEMSLWKFSEYGSPRRYLIQ